MNVRTALISSALLLAVLGWACEQQGPTGPSALATPGGGSLGAAGGVSLGAASGAILGVKKDCVNNPNDRRCKFGPVACLNVGRKSGLGRDFVSVSVCI